MYSTRFFCLFVVAPNHQPSAHSIIICEKKFFFFNIFISHARKLFSGKLFIFLMNLWKIFCSSIFYFIIICLTFWWNFDRIVCVTKMCVERGIYREFIDFLNVFYQKYERLLKWEYRSHEEVLTLSHIDWYSGF